MRTPTNKVVKPAKILKPNAKQKATKTELARIHAASAIAERESRNVKLNSPEVTAEVKERAPRSTLYPVKPAEAQADKADGVFINRHGVWILAPKDSQLGSVPFTETHKLRDFTTGKPVPAMLTRDERETYDTACAVKVGNKLEQGYVAKNSAKQPRKFADKDGTKGQKPDVARWESATGGTVAIGKARRVSLYFIS